MGRQPSPDSYDAIIGLRCLAEHRFKWQQIAKSEGMDLSDWIRGTLMRKVREYEANKRH